MTSLDSRPLVLITRPLEDAAGLADALADRGFDSLIEPMLTIVPEADAVVDVTACQAVLFTSANGVRAFTARTDVRSLPAIAVGSATAAAAEKAGFATVIVSDGDVTSMIRTVADRLKPEDGMLFHAAGSVTAGDLSGGLQALGYTVRRVVLYKADPISALSDECRAALDEERLFAATFFSPRTGAAFVRLLREAGRAPRARTVNALCLSNAVADRLSDISWASVWVADRPDTDALLNAVSAAWNERTDGTNAMADERSMDDERNDAAESAPGDQQTLTLDADAVIDAFGGIRPMATKLGVAVSTVQGWKTRHHIPDNRWRDIIAAADAHAVDLTGTETRAASTENASIETPDSPWSASDETRVDQDIDAEPPDVEETPEAEPPAQEEGMEADADRASDPSTSKSTAQTSGAEQGRSGGGGLALLAAVAALGLVVIRPLWAPYVDPHLPGYAPPSAADSTSSATGPQVETTLAELAARLAAVEARPVVVGSGDVVAEGGAVLPADLLDRIAALETGTDAAVAAALAGASADLKAELAGRTDALAQEMAGLSGLPATVASIQTEVQSALAETRTALAASVERDESTRARLVERLGVIETMLKQISAEADKAAAGLSGLEARQIAQDDAIAALERRPAVQGAALAGLALAVGDVEAALADGRPFGGALRRLAGLAPDDPAILEAVAVLRPSADTGAPTLAALETAFRRDAPAMQAELGKRDGDWIDTLVDGASALVSVRRKGDAPDDPPISRAEAALARGDLTSAVAALSPEREKSETLAAWLSGAESRLTAEAGLADLRASVAAILSGASANADMPDSGGAAQDAGAAQDEGAAQDNAGAQDPGPAQGGDNGDGDAS